MDINVLRTFMAVCEYSGFSSAAEKLGYTQSTVSSQIKQLERELNTTLFDRFYHRISLTADGAIVLQYAKNMINLSDEMLAEINRPERLRGEIRLAMSSSISSRYFQEDFLAFRQKYPGIRVIITETGTEQMFDMLRKNEVDLVFTLDSHIYDSEYVICAERKENIHFIASAAHPLASREKIPLEEMVSLPFVLTEKAMSYRQLLDHALAERSLEIRPVLEIGNPNQICNLVERSNLVSCLPDFIAKGFVRSENLKILPVEDCDFSVWTQLLMHRNKWLSPVLRTFLDYYCGIVAENHGAE